jgi:predicted enzyme related to lactoylglutathione lyase
VRRRSTRVQEFSTPGAAAAIPGAVSWQDAAILKRLLRGRKMFKKVAFTMYPIKDVPRARKFYEDTLGLKPGSVGNQGDSYWIEYDLPGGGCFALTNFIEDAPSSTAGGTVAFEVENLDGLMKDLKAKGVTFKSDIIQSPVCTMAVCLDTEGNSLLLHQLKAG